MRIDTNDLMRRLREGDPLRDEPGLTTSEIAQMRAMTLVAAHRANAILPRFGRLALAASFVLAVALGVAAAHRAATERLAAPIDSADTRTRITQVHFATPGGTRVIWTLDPSFELKGTKP